MTDDTILTANDGSGEQITFGELKRRMLFWSWVLLVSLGLSALASAALLLTFH